MGLTNEERQSIVEYRVEKAQSTLDEAKKIIALGIWNIVANRLYYCLYYAATALLINNQIAVHTHGGMLTLINQHFVQTGQLTKDEGRLLKKMFTLRQESDYEDFVEVTEDEIRMYLPLVESLMQKMIALIG